MALKISESAAVQMPNETSCQFNCIIEDRNLGFFGIHEKLNQQKDKDRVDAKSLDQNSECRIKYPRGELGQSAGEADPFYDCRTR